MFTNKSHHTKRFCPASAIKPSGRVQRNDKLYSDEQRQLLPMIHVECELSEDPLSVGIPNTLGTSSAYVVYFEFDEVPSSVRTQQRSRWKTELINKQKKCLHLLGSVSRLISGDVPHCILYFHHLRHLNLKELFRDIFVCLLALKCQ